MGRKCKNNLRMEVTSPPPPPSPFGSSALKSLERPQGQPYFWNKIMISPLARLLYIIRNSTLSSFTGGPWLPRYDMPQSLLFVRYAYTLACDWAAIKAAVHISLLTKKLSPSPICCLFVVLIWSSNSTSLKIYHPTLLLQGEMLITPLGHHR